MGAVVEQWQIPDVGGEQLCAETVECVETDGCEEIEDG